MLASRVAWTVWALTPVALLAYHFGPGQRAYIFDRAAGMRGYAAKAEAEAMKLQEAAYEKHLAAIEARRRSFLAQTPEAAAEVKGAVEAEDGAYKLAAAAWVKTASAFEEIETLLGETSADTLARVKWSRSRALVRSGEIALGADGLEALLDEFAEAGTLETPLGRSTREELATAYYYGARLMRLAGMPAEEWRAVSGKARQQFRYLAETRDAAASGAALDKPGGKAGSGEAAVATAGDAKITGDSVGGGTSGEVVSSDQQKNLELVLDLEQSSMTDLQGRPLPKLSPRTGQEGLRPGKRQGKSKRPPRQRDGRGAGGVGDIGGGW